jgi:hypothetical protein
MPSSGSLALAQRALHRERRRERAVESVAQPGTRPVAELVAGAKARKLTGGARCPPTRTLQSARNVVCYARNKLREGTRRGENDGT